MFPDNIDKQNYIPNLADAFIANKIVENSSDDKALRKLFIELCPNNTSLEDVLIKCTVLNKLYSTNIINIHAMAEHIHSLNIDERLKQCDFTLVESIANAPSLKRRFYSFATKYCAMHLPKNFNIYDKNVHKVLMHYLNGKYTNDSLKDYITYRQALRDFQSRYQMEELDAWQLDKYLWQLGKHI